MGDTLVILFCIALICFFVWAGLSIAGDIAEGQKIGAVCQALGYTGAIYVDSQRYCYLLSEKGEIGTFISPAFAKELNKSLKSVEAK